MSLTQTYAGMVMGLILFRCSSGKQSSCQVMSATAMPFPEAAFPSTFPHWTFPDPWWSIINIPLKMNIQQSLILSTFTSYGSRHYSLIVHCPQQKEVSLINDSKALIYRWKHKYLEGTWQPTWSFNTIIMVSLSRRSPKHWLLLLHLIVQ